MRYLAMLLILIMLLGGCASRRFVGKNGVFYPNQPVRELQNCFRFTNSQMTDSELVAIPIPGEPLLADNIIYLPVLTSLVRDVQPHSNTTIYANDTMTNTIKDSLTLIDEKASLKFKHLVINQDIYIIGIRDSLCQIIKTDRDLAVLQEFITDSKVKEILYAAVYNENLRIAAVDYNSNALMLEFRFENMQPERKRLLLKNYQRSYREGDNLWFFNVEGGYFTTARVNLKEYSPTPLYQTFALNIPERDGVKMYKAKAAGMNAYVSYSWISEDGSHKSKLIALDHHVGTVTEKDFPGYLSFDVVTADDKTLIFRTETIDKRQMLIISELMPDLTETNQRIAFFLADNQGVKNIRANAENGYLLTGIYDLETGRKKTIELPNRRRIRVDDVIPQAFLALYSESVKSPHPLEKEGSDGRLQDDWQ